MLDELYVVRLICSSEGEVNIYKDHIALDADFSWLRSLPLAPVAVPAPPLCDMFAYDG